MADSGIAWNGNGLVNRYAVLLLMVTIPSLVQAVDITIQTDNEQFVVSDRVMSLHQVYFAIPDDVLARPLTGKNMTLAEWAGANGVGSSRFPGGTAVKGWDWQDPPNGFRLDTWAPDYPGPATGDANSMSLDEYLQQCALSGMKPHIGINDWSGFVYDRMQDSIDRAAAQVQHIVDAGYTGVVYYIGNEARPGNSGKAGAYLDMLHVQAMKAVDPDCKVIWNDNGLSSSSLRRGLEWSEGWLDGAEAHTKWPYGGSVKTNYNQSFSDWQTTTPMWDNQKQRVHRDYADSLRLAAERQGCPNAFIANNEYGGAGPYDGKNPDVENWFQTGLIQTEQLMELMIGNYDMSAYWDLSAMLDKYGGSGGNPRLRAVHWSWEMMAEAPGATMLYASDTVSNDIPSFVVKTATDIHLYLLNKSGNPEPVNVDFSGLFTVKTDGSHYGESMVDDPSQWGTDSRNHWGTNQVLSLTYSGGTFSGTLPALSFNHIVFPRSDAADMTPPAMPTGLTALYSNGEMLLAWDDNAEGDLHEYRLWRSTASGKDYRLLDMNVDGSGYTDTGVVAGVTYYYEVQAVDTSDNASPRSDEAVGLMPMYEPVFLADFELSQAETNTTVTNLDAGTAYGGYWNGTPASGVEIGETALEGEGYYQFVDHGLGFDQLSGGFQAEAVLADAVAVDGCRIKLDFSPRRVGGDSRKKVYLRGMDALGNTSFEVGFNGDEQLFYVHSGGTESFIPGSSPNELFNSGSVYDLKKINGISITCGASGYVLELNYGQWISPVLPYNGSATELDHIEISAGILAGCWIDDLRVERLLPPDDGSNAAPLVLVPSVEVTELTAGQFFSTNLNALAFDGDGDALTFRRIAGPAWLFVREDGVVYGTPGLNDLGPSTLILQVEDPYGAFDRVNLNVGYPPVMNLGQLLIGWDQFVTPNSLVRAPTAMGLLNVSGSLTYSDDGSGFSQGKLAGSVDETFGTSLGGARTNNNQNLDVVRTATDGKYIDFEITNNETNDLELLYFLCDTWRKSSLAMSSISLEVLAGSSITVGSVATLDLPTHSGTPVNEDFDDVDIALTGLADYTLAPGESAAFRLTFNNGTDWTYLDNVAVSGQPAGVAGSTDSDGDGLDDSWELDFFGSLARNGLGDADQDGIDDRSEYLAGTDPTDAQSLLRVDSLTAGSNANSYVIQWQSVSGKVYRIMSSVDLSSGVWVTNRSGIPATPDTNTMGITNASPQLFFRVGVE